MGDPRYLAAGDASSRLRMDGVQGMLSRLGFGAADFELVGRILALEQDERVVSVGPVSEERRKNPKEHMVTLAREIDHRGIQAMLTERGFPEPKEYRGQATSRHQLAVYMVGDNSYGVWFSQPVSVERAALLREAEQLYLRVD